MKTQSRGSSLAALCVTGGFAPALLLLGAVGLFNPIETSLFWGQSALGTINVTFYLTCLLGYCAYLLLPRRTLRVKIAADILLAAALGALCVTAVLTMGARQEAWFLSFNWLLVNRGWVFGAALGLAVTSLMGTLSLASVWRGKTGGAANAQLGDEKSRGIRAGGAAWLIIGFAGFSALLFTVLRYCSVYTLTGALAGAAILLAIFSVLWLPKALPSAARAELSARPKKLAKKDKLRLAVAAVFILLFAGAGIYGLIDKSEIIFLPGAPLPGTVRAFQMAAVGLGILCMIVFALLGKSELRELRLAAAEEKGYSGKKAKHRAAPLFRTIQSIGLLFGFGTVFYYFPIVMRLPDFLPKAALFIAVGAGLYYALAQLGSRLTRDFSDLFAKISKLAGLGLFALLLCLIMRDNLQNGVQYTGYVTGDPYFPFEFIHSWGHAALAGLSLGLFLADELYYRALRTKPVGASAARYAGVGLWIFALGIICASIPHAVTLLEGSGEWPPTYGFKVGDIPFGHFFPWVFGGLLAFGVLAELASSLWLLKPSPAAAAEEIAVPKAAPTVRKKPIHSLRIAAAVLLIAELGVLALTPLLFGDYDESVRYNIGNGADIFTADSYERVSPTAKISAKSVSSDSTVNKPLIDTAIRLGGNEYGSAQLIWKTGEAVENLRGTIAFESGGNAASAEGFNTAELRLAKNIYDGAYPEILEPLDGQTLPANQNSTIWFSFFTDYGAAAGEYYATLSFTFTQGDEEKTASAQLQINVDPYSLPKNSHYLYNLPYDENDYTTSYYAKRRQFMDGGRLTDYLTNREAWYDEKNGVWDYSRPLAPEKIADLKRDWNIDALTGDELWDAFMDVAQHLIEDLGQPMVRGDYLTVIARKGDGISNPANWDGETWTGTAWCETESQIAYKFYYTLNQKLLTRKLAEGTLAERVVIKWKDEFEQSQFFPSSPGGRTLQREEMYKIYALELSEMNRARADAVKAAGLSGDMGVRYLANCDPTAENFDILFDYFDIYCPLSYRITQELVDVCKAAGKRIWQYTCCQPFLPYANQFSYNQTSEAHITQWMNYKYGLEGYWLWRSDYQNPAVFYYGFTGYLDGVFVYYPDGEKPEQLTEGSFYTGIRFEAATEAIEETELFLLLENSLNALRDAGKITADDADKNLAELRCLVDSAVDSPYLWETDSAQLKDTVGRVRSMLSALARQDGFAKIMQAAAE
ncbi:MAG: hypothetical protein LBT21_08010 [Oscillospiraceae bacterium]|jgi:hypothetical protein|nr:hypothetical protein [Oscillospiraceae bacterium]